MSAEIVTDDLTFRGYRAGDAALLVQVFLASVRGVGPRAYSAAQVAAWAAGIPNVARWAARMEARELFIAQDASGPVAWIELGRDGHVDMWYCMPQYVGCGVGGKLYRALEQRARELHIARLYTAASRISEPCFTHYGFTLDERETVVRAGVEIERARMSKHLEPAPPR